MKLLLTLFGATALAFGGIYAFSRMTAKSQVAKTGAAANTFSSAEAQLLKAFGSVPGAAPLLQGINNNTGEAGGGFLAAVAKGIAGFGGGSGTTPAPTSSAAGAITTQGAAVAGDALASQGLTAPKALSWADLSEELNANGPSVASGAAASSPELTQADFQEWGTNGNDVAAQDLTPGATVAQGTFSDAVIGDTEDPWLVED